MNNQNNIISPRNFHHKYFRRWEKMTFRFWNFLFLVFDNFFCDFSVFKIFKIFQNCMYVCMPIYRHIQNPEHISENISKSFFLQYIFNLTNIMTHSRNHFCFFNFSDFWGLKRRNMDIRQIIIHPNKQSSDPLSQPIFYQIFDTKGDIRVDTKGNTRTDTQTNIYNQTRSNNPLSGPIFYRNSDIKNGTHWWTHKRT